MSGVEDQPNYRRHVERQRDEFSNIQLRFALGEMLMRMPYGTTKIITQDQAQRAWPPTGEHAPSTFENTFRALALAAGGNRPETSYTTKERIINDLDGSFDVTEQIITGDWIIRRNPWDCPKCRGSKFVQRREDTPLRAISVSDHVGMEEAVSNIITEPCDCKPPS